MTTESVHSFSVKSIAGEQVSLSQFNGKVILIVNVASKCGFTSQYKGLQALFDKFSSKGFSVLGFPCNQFGAQEPGNEEEIKNFCSLNYNVTFPMFAKIEVNGDKADPLYSFLKSAEPGLFGTEMIKWNFTKFLIDKEGNVLRRYAPNISPESLEKDILAALEK
ncbi:MAG: glutathione peroxidase [Betaproteobacteria bacterium]|nr:glutathione peroxidase [Betaproteobacteria bacterium]